MQTYKMRYPTGQEYAEWVLGPGDVLMVTRLDRLARSTRDLLNTLAATARSGWST